MKSILIQLTNNYNIKENTETDGFDGRYIDVYIDGEKIKNLERFKVDINPRDWDFNIDITQKYDFYDDVLAEHC